MKLTQDIKSGIRKWAKHLFGFALAVCMLPVTGCRDELSLKEGPGEVNEDEDCISFTIKLDKDLYSRDANALSSIVSNVDEYDNYIDTQDKFRVFFFTEAGDFLFGATDRVVGMLQNTTSANYWYVRIPMTMIVDRENQEYDIDKIKSYLKKHPFKVAVLANWPNGGEKINPADWDDSENTQNSNANPSSTLKGNPRWNWSNSILNSKAKPQDIRNINDLHHLYNDLYYAATSNNGYTSRFGTYGQFMSEAPSGEEAGYYMGEPTDWVKMRNVNREGNDKGWIAAYEMVDVNGNGGFESKEEANRWIRANWTPEVELNQKKQIYRHYQHMWFLWNFDAAMKYASGNTTAYEDNWGWDDNKNYEIVANPFGEEWYGRNGRTLHNWMEPSYNNGSTAKAIGPIEINIGESTNDVFFRYIPRDANPAYCVKVGDNYGIQLPNIGQGEKSDYTGVMMFQARTSGTLRVKWGSRDATSSGLAVQVGLSGNVGTNGEKSTIYRNHDNVTSTTPINWRNTDDNLEYLDITINADSEPVYIFCTKGKAVVYSIEFIRGRYLYETDREGVAPSERQGIPMYGVKWFDKIEDWQRGTTHNLDGNISLIRALAKVEVYIKADKDHEPRHVYMRGMNRAARCEPIDVHTSTDSIWSDNHSSVSYNEDQTISGSERPCEWFRIQQYGPSFGNMTSSAYNDWLSWFYGSWQTNARDESPILWKDEDGNASYRWDYDNGYYVPAGNRGGWKKSGFKYPTASQQAPPHIFNPYIYRSEYCSFLYAGTEGGSGKEKDADGTLYYRYVLYVPDKNIDDPSTIGKLDSNPKVPHIEYRFGPPQVEEADLPSSVAGDPFINTEYNLDDNDCYRIYFTNYGFSSKDDGLDATPVNEELHGMNWRSSTYDRYERDRNRLTKHWPIMRNHLYRFYVGGTSPENPEIKVHVSEWGHRKVVVEW